MILHLANDYSGSTVYKNLVKELDNIGFSQIVYTPVRSESLIGKNMISFDNPKSKIIYSHILSTYYDRIFYKKKIKKVCCDIERQVDLSSINFIHAHTWYSDGGVAYLLSKKYNIPYVITIRNSDLNVFYKYLLHERSFGNKILENAKKVIVISYVYKTRVLNFRSLERIKVHLEKKMIVIPNGVNKFWIDNINLKELSKKDIYNLLFIGKFTTGKNVLPLMEAIKSINNEKKRIHLNLIGGSGNRHAKVLKVIKKYSDCFTYHGKIFDLDSLRGHFQESDIFVMPSKYETFGLVYVEALLQGLPILYTENEGIDGLYEEMIGEKVVCSDAREIRKKILLMLEKYEEYVIPTAKLVENHNWESIALHYKKIYEFI